MTIQALVLVLIGGFGGGAARYFLSGVLARHVGETFPWGTLAVNIAGSFLIGLLAGYGRNLGGALAEPWFHQLALTGFCGGFTTVSSFSLQTLNLGFDGEYRLAVLNVIASASVCVAAVALGFTVAGF
jgi:fluoride exporter